MIEEEGKNMDQEDGKFWHTCYSCQYGRWGTSIFGKRTRYCNHPNAEDNVPCASYLVPSVNPQYEPCPLFEADPGYDEIEWITRKFAKKSGKRTIQPITGTTIFDDAASQDPKSTVTITGAVIQGIERHVSRFQDHENVFYIIRVKEGTVAPASVSNAKGTPFDNAIIRASENLHDKSGLREGDIISCKGKVKNDRSFGIMIQNV
ncbi:hypothetical protein GF325_04855, partial [Candidatus Bathyarchaeota archaeon]|nr:hypothetical protein [Candidatus Bathyarchaeota archaeon]